MSPGQSNTAAPDPARTGMVRDVWILFALILAATVTQWWLLKPPAFGDQLDYFSAAAALPDVSASHRRLRIGLLLPVWAFIRMFGYSEAAYYALPFLSLAFLTAATYLTGRILFGAAVGLLSASLILFNPYVLWDSSHLLPDVLATACITFAVFLAALCGRHRTAWSNKRIHVLLVLAGVFLGWSYLTREFTAVFFPLVPLLLRACRIPWRGLLYVGAGALALFGLELLWGALVYGDPFTRLNILTSRGSGGFDPEGARQFRETDPWRILGQLPILFHQRSGGMLHGALFGCALLGPLFWIFKKEELRNRFLFVWAWCFTCYVFFTLIGLAPILFNRPLLRMHKFRYWLPILPAVYIGGAAVLLYGWSRLKGMPRILRNTMIPFLILAPIAAYASYQGIGSISGSGAFVKNGSSHYRELRSFLRTHGSHWRWMWTDQGSGKAMSLVAPMYVKGFWGNPLWDGEIRYLNSGSHFLDREALTEGPVLVHHEVIQWRAPRRTVPDYLIVPDLRWKSVFLSSNRLLVLYSTGEIGEPELLFRVTPDDW